MTRDPATDAFLRFCNAGDPQQLGVVFDRLAPELLLVASRLLPPGGDAQDVVQQTFVTAIQQRRRFDASRRVAPWLVGILMQHVRRERRRLRRRIDAQRLQQQEAQDPAAAAMTREHAEAVLQAVAALPQPYRQVLQLHLVHGLPASAVAASLERPFRTVQSQLRRGLAQLKRALPTLALAPWWSAAPLAAVRAQVLRAASSLWLGWLWLPWLRLTGLLALLVLPCALLAATLVTPEPRPLAGVGGGVVIRADGADQQRAAMSLAEAAPRLDRQLLQDPQPQCRVTLRVLAAEDKTALAGVKVSVSWSEMDGNRRYVGHHDLTPAMTDTHGQAAFDVPRGQQYYVQIQLEMDGRLGLCRSLDGPGREAAFDGVTMLRLVPGRIRVRDQHGAPVPFLDVNVGVGEQLGFLPLHPMHGQTGTDGWTSVLQLPRGDLRAYLRHVPVDFAMGDDVSLPLAVRGGDGELVLERPDAKTVIAGRILDDHGEAVVGGWAQLVRARDGVPIQLGGRFDSDAEGRFVLPVPVGKEGPFKILGGIAGQQGRESELTYETGATDAVLALRWPDGLALTVVDAKTGGPIEDFGIICFRVNDNVNSSISGDMRERFDGRHPGGRLFVDHTESGNHRLLVLPPADSDLLPSGYLPVPIAGTGVTRFSVRLQRPQPIRVHLAFGDGKPAAGSRVRLRAKLSDDDYDHWCDVRSPYFYCSSWQGRVDLAEATTDAQGVAELPWQPWHEPVIVRADGPGHVVCERELPGVEPGGAPIELRVARGAMIHGMVDSFDRLPELAVDALGKPIEDRTGRLAPSVVLRNCADGSLRLDPEGMAYPIDANGRFVCRDLPPGRWQLLFQHVIVTPVAEVMLLHRPLAEVVTISGQECTASFNLGSVMFGSLRGRVLVDGKPVNAYQLTCWPSGVDHLGRLMRRNSGYSDERFAQADGSYLIGRIPPGEVGIEARVDGVNYRLFERIAVAPGERKQVDLQFHHLIARIQLVRPDGKPVGSRMVRIADDYYRVDSSGWVTLDPAPAQAFDVGLLPPGFEREWLWRYRRDDPHLRPVPVGSIELDLSKPRSEQQLLVKVD